MCMALISPVSFMGQNAVFAQEAKAASTVIKPQTFDYFVSEHRIRVQAEITDEAGVKVARTYFRAVGEADYVFVPMQSLKDNIYEAVIPKPSKDTQTLEYIILAVNQKGQIVKTEVFKVKKDDGKEVPEWQKAVSEEGEIKVSTELAKAPEKLPGFNDSVSLDVVESSGRFGTAAGIYSLITTSSGGLSTAAVAGIAAGVVAGGVAIGAAASDDDDDEDNNIKITPSDPQTLLYGETREFAVSGGKIPYTWSENVTPYSDNTKATFNSAEAGTGTATVTVRDSQGNSASVTVEVKPNVNVSFE